MDQIKEHLLLIDGDILELHSITLVYQFNEYLHFHQVSILVFIFLR